VDYYGTGYLNMGIAQRDAFEEELKRKAAEEEANAAAEIAGQLRQRQRRRQKELLRPRTARELRNRQVVLETHLVNLFASTGCSTSPYPPLGIWFPKEGKDFW
jgi:hypothetical protein